MMNCMLTLEVEDAVSLHTRLVEHAGFLEARRFDGRSSSLITATLVSELWLTGSHLRKNLLYEYIPIINLVVETDM